MQFAQAVARLETNYGTALGGNNWGAIQSGRPPCGPGEFESGDTSPNADGTDTPYRVCFRAYASPEDGARDFVRQLYKRRPAVLAATRRSVAAAAAAMYDTHYYESHGATREARIRYYVGALEQNLKAITAGDRQRIPRGQVPTAEQARSKKRRSNDFWGWALVGIGGWWIQKRSAP